MSDRSVPPVDRLGDWMQTFSGRAFWPIDPRAEEVFIEDIAHALSLQCRFGGHCRIFYSVAEHSVRVSQVVPHAMRLAALLHDAAEAYLVDLPRPIKRSSSLGEHYTELEARVQGAVFERFGLELPLPDEVHDADNVLLMTEARDLMAAPPMAWKESRYRPLDEPIVPLGPSDAEAAFLRAFAELTVAKR